MRTISMRTISRQSILTPPSTIRLLVCCLLLFPHYFAKTLLNISFNCQLKFSCRTRNKKALCFSSIMTLLLPSTIQRLDRKTLYSSCDPKLFLQHVQSTLQISNSSCLKICQMMILKKSHSQSQSEYGDWGKAFTREGIASAGDR